MNVRPTNMTAARDAANPFLDRITDADITNAIECFLAVLIADNSAIDGCGLEPDDFDVDLHRTIFSKVRELHSAGDDANSVSLKPFIPKSITGLKISPSDYLTSLAIEGTSPILRGEMDKNVQIIKMASLARALRTEGEFAAQLAGEGHSLRTLADEIGRIETRLKERRERFLDARPEQAAGDAYIRMFEASSSRDGVVGVPIALPEIAKVLSEPVLEAGNLYGFLSSSGEGKTSLTMQIIYHAIKAGHPVLFLSYDQSAEQCVRQMIAQNKGITVQRQREPRRLLSPQEQDSCLDFAMWINRHPLQIIRCQREGVDRLIAYARGFVKRYANGNTPLVVIDHIGKVKARDPKLSPDRISGDVTVELKSFANEAAATVMILNQRNGEGGRRNNPRPIAKDLYGGEGSRADYDAILSLYRPEKYRDEMVKVASCDADWKIINRVFGEEEQWKDVAELGVIKSRFGNPNLKETVRFEAGFTRYVSIRRPAQEELI